MFKIYSSSAGSGKTYTLTKEYLKLALNNQSDTYFKHILAVTFTNAAANEMKDRILAMLRLFAAFGESRQNMPVMLADIIGELYPETAENSAAIQEKGLLLAGRARTVFRQILHRYSDFSVMTIDKFTQRLVSSFTDELGIPFIFETQLDSDLLDEAVDRLLARIGEEGEEVLSGIVERYYREQAEEGRGWGTLPAQIRQTAETLLNEQSYLEMSRVEELTMEDWIAIRKQMREYVRDQEQKITRLAKGALDMIQATFLAEKDFFQSGRGIYGYFRERSEGKKLWAEPNSYVYKTIGEGTWYGAKAPALIKNEIEALRNDLENHFHQIENLRLSESRKVVLYQQLDRHMYHLSLLGEIRKEFDVLLRQNNQVHISEFNRKIAAIVAEEPVPFIFERLGERYNHILVDEFQDTSKLQFANLLPLVENALAGGYFNLVVGDAKQSIYRFRGGDMDLILHLSQNQLAQLGTLLGNNEFHLERLQSLGYFLQLNQLRVNRRSFREITAFNNAFFAFIAAQMSGEFPLIEEVYDHYFEQEIPETVKDGGHVEIEFVEMGDEPDSTEDEDRPADPIVGRTVALVREMQERGYNWRDLAVLCRRKKEATTLANELKKQGFPLISDDALSLGYSRSVHFVISFMKVLHGSDNRLARYEAAYLFHHVIRRENPSAGEYEQIRLLCETPGLDNFLRYFERWNVQLNAFRLRQLSVFELSETLMKRFGMFDTQYESEYLFRFLDVVLEFGNRKTNHLGDFLNYWQGAKNKLSITIPDETDAIRITTIHKSKGLEYPVVIVPYAQWKTSPNARLDRIWVNLDEVEDDPLKLPGEEAKRLRSSMVSVVKDLENTALTDQYQNEKTRTLIENLNLLYVAFTRPVQRLYVLAKREKSWESGQQVNHWLKDFLASERVTPAWDEGLSRYVIAQGTTALQHAHLKSGSETFYMRKVLSNDRTESLRLRRLADRIFDVETFEPRLDQLQKTKYLLTRLRTLADLPDTLERMTDEGIFVKKEAAEMSANVHQYLANPLLGHLYQEGSRVQINKELLVPGGKMLHIDRVVQQPDGSTTFVTFIGGSAGDESRRHLKKLIAAFKDAGKKAAGILVMLGSETVEMVTA